MAGTHSCTDAKQPASDLPDKNGQNFQDAEVIQRGRPCPATCDAQVSGAQDAKERVINTPAHMALGLAVLGRRPVPVEWGVILGGALLPDLFLFVAHFAGDGPAVGLAAEVFNSVPVYAVLLLAGLAARARLLWLFAAAALLHIAFDLPVHHQDAHAHFWPLTDWVFVSPVSFWDADHHGRPVGVLEGVLVAVCLALLWLRTDRRFARIVTALLAAIYLAAFVHFVGHVFAGRHWAVW